LGGWSLSDPFSELARSKVKRKKFADNCAKLALEYDFDGIDIDWEYPGFAEHSGSPDDKQNFNLLLDDVREALDTLGRKTGKRYGLTAALPCGPDHIANIDVPHLNTVLDEFHLMSYGERPDLDIHRPTETILTPFTQIDFNGAWSELSGVHSPMYYQGWGPKKFSLDDCVKTWHDAGTPMSKINIGLSFYGRTFATATGLQQEHSGSDIAHWGPDEGTPMYYNILQQLPSMTSVRHEPTKTQYAYFNGGGTSAFIAYFPFKHFHY
jgi:chitinase